MENATEALKIAFGVMMFVLALTLSISTFSQATQAVDSITTLRDRETQYTYVEPSSDSNRTVGVETIVPMMYKAYKENFKIIFLDTDGVTPLPLYYETDSFGERTGNEINCIDLESEILPSATEAINHLDILLAKRPNDANSKYYKQFLHTGGLYEFLSDKRFKELLGEYYQEDAKEGRETEALNINKTKKRVITYILLP